MAFLVAIHLRSHFCLNMNIAYEVIVQMQKIKRGSSLITCANEIVRRITSPLQNTFLVIKKLLQFL